MQILSATQSSVEYVRSDVYLAQQTMIGNYERPSLIDRQWAQADTQP